MRLGFRHPRNSHWAVFSSIGANSEFLTDVLDHASNAAGFALDLDVVIRVCPHVSPVQSRHVADEVRRVAVGRDVIATSRGIGDPAVRYTPSTTHHFQLMLDLVIASRSSPFAAPGPTNDRSGGPAGPTRAAAPAPSARRGPSPPRSTQCQAQKKPAPAWQGESLLLSCNIQRGNQQNTNS